MTPLAIVPARDRSGPVPDVELMEVAGHPLIAHSIRHGIEAELVHRLVVSTDDPKVAAVAQRYGADVVERPPGLGAAGAGPDSILGHAVSELEPGDDPVVVLQPGWPLRPPGLVDAAVRLLGQAEADSVFSCTALSGPAWRVLADGPISLSAQGLSERPGDGRPEGRDVVENGSLYVVRPWVVENLGARVGGRIATIDMHPLDSTTVDGPTDVEIIEQLWPFRSVQPDPRLADIELLVLDFDGVLTDNAVFVSEDETETVRVDRGDGWGVARLREAGVEVVIMSTEHNPVVAARAKKLRVPSFQAIDDKAAALTRLLADRERSADQTAFVGNDVNDLGAMAIAGVAIAVADARHEVLARADLVTVRPGGKGAVREIADRILRARTR